MYLVICCQMNKFSAIIDKYRATNGYIFVDFDVI